MATTFTKNKIDVTEYLSPVLKALKKGVLLTTKNGDKVNSMTISWGQIGIEWNKLIFTAFVRSGRFTHRQLQQNPEFTININTEGTATKILGYCGTKSGRDVNKIAELQLTTVEGNKVASPAIAELPLTLECKVIYTQAQNREAIPEAVRKQFYPENVPGDFHSANADLHTVFYGEIVDAYLLDRVEV